MATHPRQRAATTVIREEDLDELNAMKRDIEARIEQARNDGRTYMMSQHVRILALLNVEIKRLRDRFDRELLAGARKEAKILKEEQRTAAVQQEA